MGLLAFLGQAKAQQNDTEWLQKQFSTYTDHNLAEKVYLNTDRNFYMPGEIIWFKTYLVNEASHHISGFSKVVYVDIISESNRPVLQAKIALNNGLGNGSLYIPLSFSSGKYKIRAYTNWMKNFDAAFYFEKPITVINTLLPSLQSAPVIDPVKTNSYDIQFFPEGGNLVKDVESKIAFRLSDQYGAGVQQFKGIILSEQNDTIAHFSPYTLGIGNFYFTPSYQKGYTAKIQLSSGEIITKKLPDAQETGYTMRIQQATDSSITVNVTSTANTGNGSAIYLFVHTRGVIKQTLRQVLQNNKAVFNIDADTPGEGITHFTIFNSQKQPVCERIHFKKPSNKLMLHAATTQQKYTTRKKITVDINSKDVESKNEKAHISLSVYRIDSLQTNDQPDIYSYLWLSSDIKGTVESPGWYFNTTNDSAVVGLDNLMLTHGWRRFKWQDIQQTNRPVFTFLPEYDGHIINGKIFDTATRKPFPESVAYLSVPGSYTQFYATRADKEGNLRFYTRNAYGPGELILQAEGLNESAYHIEVNSAFSEKYSDRKLSPLVVSENMTYVLQQNSINAQVLRKFAAEQIKQYRFPDVDTSSFYGKPDEKYLLDDYTRFTTMEEVLREYVMGVLVGKSGGKFKLTSLDLPNNRLFRDNPLVLLDGVPVLDMDRIMNYDPLKVRKIELVKRRYYYGPLMLDGIVNMTTYKGTMDDFEMDPKAIILDYDGLQLQREFYSPVYETEEQQKSRLADYRNLLFWSPDINTNAKGNTSISFYSSDLPGKYKGIVEGITMDGKAGSYEFTFEVK